MTEAPGRLSAVELAARLDAILVRGEELVRSASRQTLEQRWAGDLSLLDLAYRMFRLGLGFADAMDFGRLPETWLGERAPADLEDGAAVARYAALVRGRLGGWFEGASPDEYARLIDVPSGRQSGHDLLRWITACAAQDLQELQARLPSGPEPRSPVPRLDGLSMPHEDA